MGIDAVERIGRCVAAACAAVLLAGMEPAHAQAPASCPPEKGLGTICGPVGSEDLARIPGTPWLIASGLNLSQPAHLYLIDTRRKSARVLFPVGRPRLRLDRVAAPDCPGPPDLARLSTDGLGIRRGWRGVHLLYAANHGDRNAIEMFRVHAAGPRPWLEWIGCAPTPPGTLPNAVAPLPDGGLLVTSFYDPADKDPWGRMARGELNGRVLRWRAGEGFGDLPGPGVSGANGVETSADGSVAYVSAWSGRKLLVISLRDGERREIPLDFLPDNIHRLPDGTLLVGGQRARVEEIGGCSGARCQQPWVIVKVDPATSEVRPLLSRLGTAQVVYASGGMAVNGVLYVTVRGDRRVVFKPLSELPSLQ